MSTELTLTPKQGALFMAARGFWVFPLRPNSKLPFEMKVDTTVPKGMRGGIHRATIDLALIGRWFEHCPTMNYGVDADRGPVGAIVDLDPRKSVEWLKDVQKYLDPVPLTFTIKTPSGGVHFYFSGETTGQSPICKTIDVRSVGGYVVGPGSVIDGVPYQIVRNVPLIEMPAHIRQHTAKPKERRKKASAPVPPPLAAPLVDEESEEATIGRTYLAKLPGALKGERNDALFRHACNLKDKGVTEEIAVELLLEWGMRCDPPYAGEEDEAEIRKSVASAYAGEGSVKVTNASEDFEPVHEAPEVLAAQAYFKGLSAAKAAAAAEAAAPKKSPHVPVDLKSDPATSIQQRPWLFDNMIMRGFLNGIVAPGGIGKSALTIGMAVAAAHGDAEFLGMRLKEPGRHRTLLLSNEDDIAEMRRRIYAACSAHQLDRTLIHGAIESYPPEKYEPFKAFIMRQGNLVETEALEILENDLVEKAKQGIPFSQVVFDPFVEMHEGDENKSSDVAKVMQSLRDMCQRCNVAGIVVHHTRKLQAGNSQSHGDADDARGSSAFRGNVRTLHTLLRPSPEDIERYGWNKPGDHKRYLRLDNGKSSYAPATDDSTWYEVLSGQVGNGETAVVLKWIEPIDKTDDTRAELFVVIWPILATAEDKCAKLRELVDALAADPTTAKVVTPPHGGNAQEYGKSQLRKFFRQPYTQDGKTIVLRKVNAKDYGLAGSEG